MSKWGWTIHIFFLYKFVNCHEFCSTVVKQTPLELLLTLMSWGDRAGFFFKNKIEIKINRFSLFQAQLVVFHAFKMTLKTMIIFGNALFWLNGTTVREIIRSGNARSYCSRSKQKTKKKKQRSSVYSRGYFKLTRIITFSKNIIPHEVHFWSRNKPK